MDIQNNQPNLSSIPTPPSVPVPPTPPAHKKNIIWLSIIFVCVVIILVSVFYFPRSKPSPVVEKKDNTPAVLNQTNVDYYTNYAKVLASSLGVSAPDPFNLDANTKQQLAAAKGTISNSPTVVIIDGTVYPSLLSLSAQGDSYKFRPSTGLDVKGFEVVKKENIAVDDLIKNRDELEKGVIKIIYPYIQKSPSLSDADIYKSAKKEIDNYLDSQISLKKLVLYTYDEVDGNMRLTYPGIDMPFKFNPINLVGQIYFVINAYSDPETYSKDLLAEYNKRIGDGEILIVNNNQDVPEIDFVDRNTAISDISIMIDDSLSATQKISKLSGGVNIISSYKEYEDAKVKEDEPKPVSFLSPETVYAQSNTSGADDLMNRDGSIVPPYKDISYFIGPDPNVVSQNVRLLSEVSEIADIRDPQNGDFASFFKNGFSLYFWNGISPWGEKHVEDIVSILKDKRISIFYWFGHGGEDGGVSAELYDLGPLSFDISKASTSARNDQLQKRSQFDNRISDLKAKYGQDAISGDIEYSDLDQDHRIKYIGDPLLLASSLRIVLSSSGNLKLGDIIIKPSLVKTQSKDSPKSVVYFSSCFGGLFAGYFNTRVLLAPEAKLETSELQFSSDLKKISNYLLKDTDKINNTKVNTDNARNYDVLTKFNQDQFSGAVGSDCLKSNDSLCTVKLYSKNPGQTVSVSPHVKSADAIKITFNVPMDNSVPVEQVVTIDASQCKIPDVDLASLKPTWTSDMAISMYPWDRNIYRNWDPTDFDASGNPKVGFAKITVRNVKALSKVSEVNLTGNTDCFGGTAKHPECWQKPDTLIYNGNHPNTDFTYAMPCALDNVYYKDSCKNKIIKVLAPTKGIGDFPQYAGLDDGCYSKVEPSDAEKSSAASIELQTFYNETIVRSSCSPSCEKQGPQEIVDSSACFAVDNSYRDGGMIEKDGRQHNLFTLWRWSCSGRPCDMEDLAVLIPGDDANTHSLSYLIKQTKEMPEKVCRISGGEEK